MYKEENKNKCFVDYCSSVEGYCFLICEHQFASFWYLIFIYWDIYLYTNNYFTFENKFLNKPMFLLSFEFLINCYFLAFYDI